MTTNDHEKWLLLIHQIPPQPNALRVKIWRRLHQVGAVAIKQSVYVLPLSEQAREDLNWVLKEIGAGGGEGSISEVRFLEGLNDGQVRDLFQTARRADYEKIIQESNQLLREWSSGEGHTPSLDLKSMAQVSKLRHRLEEVAAVDFFHTPERETAESLLNDLAAQAAGATSTAPGEREGNGNLKGKTWVTRRNLFVDRMACGWLIRRFIDNQATFRFVPESRYSPRSEEIPFDLFEGEFTHEGDRCTFEVMLRRLGLRDRALDLVAEIVHDIDLKDRKYGRPETDGIRALLSGLAASRPDDNDRLEEGFRFFENLYAFFQRHQGPPTPGKP